MRVRGRGIVGIGGNAVAGAGRASAVADIEVPAVAVATARNEPNDRISTTRSADVTIDTGTRTGAADDTVDARAAATTCHRAGDTPSGSIAVDGANRKWVGTKNGVWLVSTDGEKVIERFTEENSPLLSNDVRKITVDPITGEVFMLTFKGICSFRGTATEGTSSNQSVLVFPNPVPPSYKGMIAIRGVANNAIVKITELDGRIVYQTKAFGGQAVWNGKNYKGQNVSSGVYLVLIADEANQEKAAAKIVIIR